MPTPAELAIAQDARDRDARLSALYAARGQPGAAERFSPSIKRNAQLSTTANALSKEGLLSTLNSNDRELIAAQLRANASYAAEQLAKQKAKANQDRYDRERIRKYEDMVKYSNRAADTILSGTGAVSSAERVLAGRSVNPERPLREVKSIYATGDEQARARAADLRVREVDRQRENTGFTGTRSEYIDQQRAAETAAQRQAATDQRQYYEATGGAIEGPFGNIAKERGYKSPITPAQQQAAQTAMVREGKATLIDSVTGRPYQTQTGGVLYAIRTPSEERAARAAQASELAKNGQANFQSRTGEIYQVTTTTTDPTINIPTGQDTPGSAVDNLWQVDQEAGNAQASFEPPKDIGPEKLPFVNTYIVNPLGESIAQADKDASTYFKEGGAYIVPGITLKGGAFSLGIVKGIVQETQNVGTVVSGIALGAVFGGAQRAAQLGSRSTSTFVRTSAKGTAKALPFINLVAVGAYAVERGYSGAKAADEGKFGEFVGQTGVQLATFGIGSAAAKTVIAPRQLAISGRPTSEVIVEGFGETKYTGVGQEVNAPVVPTLIKKTTYTETADAYLGRFGPVRTRVTEFGDKRFVTRDIGGTKQEPVYRIVSSVQAKPPAVAETFKVYKKGKLLNTYEQTTGDRRFIAGNVGGTKRKPTYRIVSSAEAKPRTVADGVPVETVKVYKKGKLVNTYEQTAEDFGKVQVTTAYNTNKQRKVTTSNLVKPKQPGTKELTTERFRKELRPQTTELTQSGKKIKVTLKEEKSVVGQTAGEERLLKIKQVTGDYTVTGTIGVGTRSDAVSFTRRANVKATQTPIKRVITDTGAKTTKKTTVGRRATILEGTAKVELQVTDAPLKNEFTQSVNRVYQETPTEVTITETGTTATESVGVYAGTVRKPLIETIGEKHVTIAGLLEVKPKTTTITKSTAPVTAKARQVINVLNQPRLQGEDLGLKIAKVETQLRQPSKTAKTIPLLTTSGDVRNNIPIPEPTRITALDSNPNIQTSFSIPQGTQTPTGTIPATISGTNTRQENSIQLKSTPGFKPVITPTVKDKTNLEEVPLSETTPTVRINLLNEQTPKVHQVSQPTRVTQTTQATTVTQVQEIAQTTQVRTPFERTPARQIVEIPEEPPITPFKTPTPDNRQGKLFDVEVRRQGQFRTFTTQGLRLDQAVQLGESVADTTAARSFKIVDRGTGQPISGDTRAQAERLLTPGRYREAKADKNIFVERSRFAINTPGEKGEIKPKRGVFGDTTNNSPFKKRVIA